MEGDTGGFRVGLEISLERGLEEVCFEEEAGDYKPPSQDDLAEETVGRASQKEGGGMGVGIVGLEIILEMGLENVCMVRQTWRGHMWVPVGLEMCRETVYVGA